MRGECVPMHMCIGMCLDRLGNVQWDVLALLRPDTRHGTHVRAESSGALGLAMVTGRASRFPFCPEAVPCG